MPLRDFVCHACDDLKQERFYHRAPEDCVCAKCGGPLELLPLSAQADRRTSTVFPFTSKHIDGKGTPIVVESMAHLRQLERRHGVVLTAFSQNPGNPDSPRDLPTLRE